jgi:ribosomal protein S18 acetylase RimI-like enzyme
MDVLLSSERPIPAEAVRALYDTVRWWPERSGADIATVLAGSLAVGAWLDGRLVGFARAISDGRFHAYVDDVVVHPDHRRRGVGGRLVSRLVAALSDVDEVTLFSGVENVSFYENLGFGLWEKQRVLQLRNRRSHNV